MSETRDIEAAYRQARIADHATYLKAGQKERAEQVAQVLRDRHGYDVDKHSGDEPKGEPEDEPEQESPTEETTAADPAPEAAVEPKPAARRPGRPPRQSGK